MIRRENLLQQISRAEQKLSTIENNVQHLEEKRNNINRSIAAQKVKMDKILFFLEKTRKTLEG